MSKLNTLFGLAGVHPGESIRCQHWGRYFDFISLWVVIWLFVEWHFELKGIITKAQVHEFYVLVWCIFTLESASLLYMVKDKKRYFLANWMHFFIIIVGLPLFFAHFVFIPAFLRLIRVVFIVGLIIPWLSSSWRFLSDNRLDTTLLTAFLILIISGLVISELEPEIHSLSDGVWWAWVTVSTVGYGDITPKTGPGRLFGGVLILIGMGLFSIITANFAAIFIKQSQKLRHYKEHKKMDSISHKEDSVEDKLDKLMKKVEQIEKRLDEK